MQTKHGSKTNSEKKLLDRRGFLAASAVLGAGLLELTGCSLVGGKSRELSGKTYSVRVDGEGGLNVHQKGGEAIWESSTASKPQLILDPDDAGKERTVGFGEAGVKDWQPFEEGRHRGYRTRLGSFPGTDLEIELVHALDSETDELLVRLEQTGGQDRIRRVNHFYRIEKPTSDGGYLLVPHGSGYLIPADMAESMPKGDSVRGNLVGGRYSLPLFGLVKGGHTLYQIVETFWDCSVEVDHIPGEVSLVDFNWLASLGELGYARQFLMRFAQDLDHVGIAKAYRRYAREKGFFRTLADRARQLPAIDRYLRGFEFRWVYWKSGDESRVLKDLQRWKRHGMPVNFFFPKWSPGTTARNDASAWQAFLRRRPVEGGWRRLRRLADRARRYGVLIKVFINPNTNLKGAPGYDPARSSRDRSGELHPRPSFWGDGLSPQFGPEALRRALDYAKSRGFEPDALYFDGYAFHGGHREDFSPDHPVSRKLAIEKQIECFRETRKRGIIPGAELARFWCVSECDFFFFTDWSRDRLAVGEPIPWFQLVFHECYAACFSGGGYGRYDWPEDKNPRLYELLFAAAPSYNWILPYGDEFPGTGLEDGVPVGDWGTAPMRRRIQWLQRWSGYFQKTAHAEMTSHRFLNPERSLQRLRFDNGVTAEFDFSGGLCRIQGVEGFSGEWEKPHEGSL